MGTKKPQPKPPTVPKCSACGQAFVRCKCKDNNLNK